MNKKILLRRLLLWMISLCLLPMSACREELCYNHADHVPTVRILVIADWELEWERLYNYDWQKDWHERMGVAYDDLRPEAASGIRVLSFREKGGQMKYNIDGGGGLLHLDEGKNDLLFYNNDTYYVVFSDLSSFSSASASTRTKTRSTFYGLHANERTVAPPDALFGHCIEGHVSERTMEDVPLPITMRPLTYTYLIRYEIVEGLQYVTQTRGAIAGMAEAVYLKNGQTTDEAVTLLYDCEMTATGAKAQVVSFGIPGYPDKYYNRAPETRVEHYALNLECCLTNGEVRTYEFDITDQMTGQPRGGVIEVGGIKVAEPGHVGGGGFSVDVTDWGAYEDVEIEF